MKKVLVGKLKLGPKVDISDPYYRRDEGERINDLPLKEGAYACSVVIASDEEPDGMGERVAAVWIEPDVPVTFAPKAYRKIGSIGVDTAMVNILDSKTEIPEGKMLELSEKICRLPERAMVLEEHDTLPKAFLCRTGLGDGYYPVYGVKNKAGIYVTLHIHFL